MIFCIIRYPSIILIRVLYSDFILRPIILGIILIILVSILGFNALGFTVTMIVQCSIVWCGVAQYSVVQRYTNLKLADAVEFIEAKLDVQTDDVGQVLARTRTEQRAQYAELKRDIIDVYTCIVDVTGAVTSASTPLPPQPHEQLDGQRTPWQWWQKDVKSVTPALLPQVTPPTHLYL